MEMKLASPYTVIINHTPNGGVLVNIGCATFAYGNTKKMLADLRKYLEDPATYEKRYSEMVAKSHGVLQTQPIPPPIEPYSDSAGVTISGGTGLNLVGSTIAKIAEPETESTPADEQAESADTAASYAEDSAKDPAQEQAEAGSKDSKKS